MDFFKPVFMAVLCGLLICSILVVCFHAPAASVIMGGFSVVVFSLGKSIYEHYQKRIKRKMNPLL